MNKSFDRWFVIKPLVALGKSDYETAKISGIPRATVQRLRSRFHGNDHVPPPDVRAGLYDWDEIQLKYDTGSSWRDLTLEFGCSVRSIQLAIKRGELKTYRSVSESVILSFKKGKRRKLNITEENRRKISVRQSTKNSGGRCKWFEVDRIKVQGTWERDLALKFLEWGVNWEKPIEDRAAWEYRINGKLKRYTPDFYLPEFKLWIEVKGHWWGNDFEKMAAVLTRYPDKKIVLIGKGQFKKVVSSKAFPLEALISNVVTIGTLRAVL